MEKAQSLVPSRMLYMAGLVSFGYETLIMKVPKTVRTHNGSKPTTHDSVCSGKSIIHKGQAKDELPPPQSTDYS